MKHAYLIIAHNEFAVLQTLISMLDDERNILFVHIDRKVKVLPNLHTEHAQLAVLDKRLDVRWGNYSQIQVELLLMQTARGCGADFYHIVSGTTLPLSSLDEIDHYFEKGDDAYFAPMENNKAETELKIQRFNFNTKHFICTNKTAQKWNQLLWHIMIALQKILRIKRNRNECFIKASNWCTLSSRAEEYLCEHSKEITNKYRYSLCGDEYFAVSELSRNGTLKITFPEDYLYADFDGVNPKRFSYPDSFESLKSTHCLWARKFTSE